jgi:regulatory protein
VGVVTAVVPDARREGRLAVCVDGQPAAVISLGDLERLGISPGATVDLAALAEADADCALYDRALRLLAARSRSAAEIRRRLRRDGAPAAAHARAVTRSRVRSRPASSRRIEQELRRQGVAADVAAEAISEVFADEAIDEAAVAEAVARKRAALLGDLPGPAQRRRLYGYLARRGYSPDIVRAAVEAVLK